ncbi:hypothetical protein SmB9_11320 [Sphingosinicella microcystinivorans]|uniref:Uncharacterized protein n=1 Tax=Sphingosinicella microcystinivorans TaxID=335406 RepID=A0AAD1D536_SPHMI|nr:hypothetical protein DFR51_0090 [Sphingosinicella microcystinivorans]BBE33474.1 hypothetical protein SmB9_11320 [Sphingosinicella microcystinivorans]
MRCRAKSRPTTRKSATRKSGVYSLDGLNLARTSARAARLLFTGFGRCVCDSGRFRHGRGSLLVLRRGTAATLGRCGDFGLLDIGTARAARQRAEGAFVFALIIFRLRRGTRLLVALLRLLTLGALRTLLALRPLAITVLTIAVLALTALRTILPLMAGLETLALAALFLGAAVALALFVLVALVLAVIIFVADVALVILAAAAIRAIIVLLVLRLTLFLPRTHLGDDAVVVIGVLQIIFGLDAFTLLVRLAGEIRVFLEQLKRIAPLARLHVAVAHFATATLLGTRIAAPTTPTGLLLSISHEILFSPILPAEPTVVVQDVRSHPRKGPEATAKRFCLS